MTNCDPVGELASPPDRPAVGGCTEAVRAPSAAAKVKLSRENDKKIEQETEDFTAGSPQSWQTSHWRGLLRKGRATFALQLSPDVAKVSSKPVRF